MKYKEAKLIETENRLLVARGEGKWMNVVQGFKIPVTDELVPGR